MDYVNTEPTLVMLRYMFYDALGVVVSFCLILTIIVMLLYYFRRYREWVKSNKDKEQEKKYPEK